MKVNQIAVQLFTVRDFTQTAEDLDTTFGKIAEIGYKAVQISCIGPIKAEVVKELADKHGLAICATHNSYDRFVNDLDAVISEHLLWNCRYAGVGIMPPAFRERGKDGYIAFAEAFNRIGSRLREFGIQFVYHNHRFEYERFAGQTGMDWMLQYGEPEAFQFELDTYWAQAGGADPAAWIHKLDGRMKVIHLKDMEIVDNEPCYAEVGSGNMNWPAIFEACRETGMEWYVVEQDTCRGNPFESIATSYEYLLKHADPSDC
ncbi:sugar phosphate isomerase/epimerase family protein [Paenibacillus contaminans]|uniref:Sugar phosphate isomerase/epimerase n=1 Tax=Paenibacillus contaminans TaxID=450362 RepID=A0A329N092_9BACL|nr:sugar phosphate isomerase/epimerase [Paenibacillus contaminans]RAV23087.1 sugar phosphate isomerase/epimerase [Paenibacillus contaminans]